ncbi:hypothetical protein SLS64_013861 [Diaporthe eres]
MKSTAAEVEAALAEWRSTNASRNKQRLKIYVDAIMNAEDDEADEEDLNRDRLDSLAALLEDTSESLAADGIGTPAEFLERFDELAPKYRLDGTEGGDCTPQQRADISGREFAELETVLKERAPEGVVRDTIAVPEEFRVLARHVLGICGPHLPKDQHVIAMNFWADDVTQSIASRVHRPSDIPFGGGDLAGSAGLEVALGWCPGLCTDGDFVCVYSRELDGDEWAWRFAWTGPGDLYVCDTIPELFRWILDDMANSRLPNLEGMSDGDILGGMWGGV